MTAYNPRMNFTTHFSLFFLSSLLTLTTVACGSSPSTKNDNTQVIQSIRAVMEAQQAAWNRGDIDGFMKGYERAETTTFVSGDEITRGWQTVLDRYKQRYNSPDRMGMLSFTDLEVQPISPSYALADGRWRLTRAGDSPHGRFTLLFRETPDGWRIAHDTTTAASE
jgi:ketosteroid isomerase-like protein